MSVPESVLVVIFMMAIVFCVLILLSFIIKIFSRVLAPLAKEVPAKAPAVQAAVKAPEPDEDFSSGTLKLKNVDEPTAAMIMAIVSDESGIPLKELVFKSITLVSEHEDGRQEP